jgi:ubiquinone biosynthesis protein
MSEQIGRRAFTNKIKKNLPAFTEHLPDLPLKLNKIIDEAAAGKLEIQWKSEELNKLRREIDQNHRNTVAIISGSTLFLSGTLLLIFGPGTLIPATVASFLGSGLGLSGGLILLRRWWSSERSL